MNKPILLLGASTLCFALLGCGDGTLEIKSKTAPAAPSSPVIVVEKPNETPSREVIKTETRTPLGETRTTETKTTTP